MAYHLGISGIVGLDPSPFKHIIAYARQHRAVPIAMGDIGHDAAAVLVKDGQILFAVEEERLNRQKHFMGQPRLAVQACAAAAGVDLESMRLSYYLNPSEAHRTKRLDACATFMAPTDLQAVGEEYDHARNLIAATVAEWPNIALVDHHSAHAASAFYTSGFDRALVLVADGQGESESTSVFLADDNGLHPIVQLPVTSSLGLLYSAVTAYLGFEPIEDEYKVMGLAAYGTSDDYKAFFDSVLIDDGDAGFAMPTLVSPTLTRLSAWKKVLGLPRKANGPIEPRHIAIAYSLQKAVERVVLRLLEHHARQQSVRKLCLAGGVALNCSLNGVIDRSGLFDEIYVQPAAGDPGAGLGAALLSYYRENPRGPRHRLRHTYLGPEFDDQTVCQALEGAGDQIEWTRPEDYVGEVAKKLAEGAVIGWFQGRMEFGPRALGNRSILADARRPEMKDRVNQAVKKREEFRPFAPSVTAEAASTYFELRTLEQYEHMTIAVNARPEKSAEIPSVVHVNGTARVQVVKRETNPGYWELLTRFGNDTGTPLLLNTSFNIRGEPIVCTPEDAVRCFLGTGITHLAIHGYLVSKRER